MTVRAVFAGDLWHGATGTALNHGFRELGWDVYEVSSRDHYLTSHLKPLRLAARLLDKVCERSFNDAILSAVARCGAEVLLTVKGGMITAATLATLREQGVFCVNFYPDVEFDHPGMNAELLRGYDLVATTKSFHFPSLENTVGAGRAVFVHHGYSPLVHHPSPTPLTESGYQYDIAYIGNASPYKRDWLLGVAEAFPDRSLLVMGHRWKDLARGTMLEPAVRGYAIEGDVYARLIEASRINIAVHSGPVGKNRWEDQVSTRTFEIPACDGFMLHIDNDEIRGLYDVPSEIDTFADPDELCGKIAYYLERPALRREMIERAHARCVPAHGHVVRAAEVADLVETAMST